MYVGEDFAAVQTDEIDSRAFDFVNSLSPGEAVLSAAWNLTVIRGTDSNPSSRLGSAFVIGTIAAQVLHDMVGDVMYALEATATTNFGNKISLWAKLPCVNPPEIS